MAEHEIVELDIGGVGNPKVAVYKQGDQVISERLRKNKIWDPTTTSFLQKWLRRGSVVIDVGANIGYDTVVAASIVGKPGRVFSFEPHPDNFKLLKKSIEANSFSNVHAFQLGVACRPGKLTLYSSASNQGAHSTLDPNIVAPALTDEDHGNVKKINIDVVALDEFLPELDAFNGHFDLMKIDTEGLDISVLTSAHNIIMENSNKAAILFEGWPQANAASETPIDNLLELIDDAKFDIWINVGDRDFAPFNTSALAEVFSVGTDLRFHFNVLLTPRVRRMVDIRMKANPGSLFAGH